MVAIEHNAAALNFDCVFSQEGLMLWIFSSSIPQGLTVRCQISRDKHGLDRGVYPTYYLHLEEDDGKFFLLAARRRKRSRNSNYVISCDATNLSRSSESIVAKLKANFLGTHFTLSSAHNSLCESSRMSQVSLIRNSGLLSSILSPIDLAVVNYVSYFCTCLVLFFLYVAIILFVVYR